MRPLRNADSPRRADRVPDGFLIQIVVEYDHARVAAIGHVDESFAVDGDRMRRAELQRTVATRADRFHEPPVLVVLHNPGVAVAVRDENVALRIPRDVGRPMKAVRTIRT